MGKKIVLLSVLASIAVAGIAWAATTPSVGTGGATAIANTGVTLHGTVNTGGLRTAYNFAYGTSTAYGATSATRHASAGTVAVAERVGGLTPGTLYHYRIEAANNRGSASGRDRTFTTTGHPPPGATTGVATQVTQTTAVLTGSVVTQGQITSAFFQYGTGPLYGVQTPVQDVTASNAAQPISYAITGLAPGTTFHFRLVAAHPGFGEYGADQAFTTIPLVRWRAKVTAHTTPARARRRPYLFTSTGTVVASVALPPGVGCTGLLGVRFVSGHRVVAFRRVALQPNCTYGVQVGFRHLVNHTATRLRVVVHFGGNAYLRAAGARTRRVWLG